jgi:hypothetical protein
MPKAHRSRGKNGIQSCWKYTCGKIAIAAIANNENDGGMGLTGCNLLRDPTGTCGRYARKQTFFSRHLTASVFGIVLTDINQFIDVGRIVDFG